MIAPASLTALPRTGGDLVLHVRDTLEEIPAFAGMSGYKYACNPASQARREAQWPLANASDQPRVHS